MRSTIVSVLCCPSCRASQLELSVFNETEDEIIDGSLTCSQCSNRYWIVGGIPRMLGPELYQPPNDWTWKNTAVQSSASTKSDYKTQLKRHTIDNFGHQWTEWGHYGWTKQEHQHERKVFHYKSLLNTDDLRGKVVLDAGCGNGRYSHCAAEHAQTVFAMDLGPAVESAYRNLSHLSHVHVIQGDLFHVPVQQNVLDVIFSIGVLMHTGNAHQVTTHLTSLLKPGGSITVHLYHEGTPMYEFNDRILREVTTKMSIPTLHKTSQYFAHIGSWLQQRGWLGYANILMRLHDEEAANFDWYAAPIATHHTYPEVLGWFSELGLHVVADNQSSSTRQRVEGHGLKSRIRRFLWRDWALTVRGIKPASNERSANPVPRTIERSTELA